MEKPSPLFLARHRLQLTQAEVADLAGIARASYTAIENGKRQARVAIAVRIARVLRRPVEELFPYRRTPQRK